MYARMSCEDEYGRLIVSDWSSAASVSELSQTISFDSSTRYIYGVISASNDCYLYVSSNSDFSDAASAKITDAKGEYEITSDEASTLYARHGCLDDSLTRRYSSTVTVDVPAKSLGVKYKDGLSTAMLTEESLTLDIESGTAPYSYTLHSGLGSVTSNVYTAPTGQATTAVIRVTDANGSTADHTVTVTIAPITIDSPPVNVPVNSTHQLVISGGVPPYTYTALDDYNYPPYDVSVNASNELIIGPSAYGSNITVKATDTQGNFAEFVMNIIGSPYISGPSSVRENFHIDLTVNGGLGPYSMVVTSGGGSVVAIDATTFQVYCGFRP